MKTSENTSTPNTPPSIEMSSKVGEGDGPKRARARKQQGNQSSGRVAVPNTSVFGEQSSSLNNSAKLIEGKGTLSSDGLRDTSSTSPRKAADHSPSPADADSELPALVIPADLRIAMTNIVAGDETSGASQEGEVQLRSSASIEDVASPEDGDELDVVETGAAGRLDTVGTGDQVISGASRAASALAAAADTSMFGIAALGVASNMADFLAPAIVDGIEDPLTRAAAAAGFSGIFLGLTASVTTAVGNDLAQMITENRITPKEPEGDVSRGSQLWSAVKNQTIPAYVGFAAAFVTANAWDAEAQVMGDPDPNPETVLLKLARATAGGVGLGLAREAAKSFSDHSLEPNEANRVFDNTRKLGEAIKKNVTSLPQAMSAYTRPTERGKDTELGTILGASFGFATYAVINGVVSGVLQNEYGEDSNARLSEPAVQAAIATAAGVAGFVIADQLTRNIYANVIPVREAPVADEGNNEIPEIDSGSDSEVYA